MMPIMGVIVMSVFASIWSVWALALVGGQPIALYAAPILVSALMIAVAIGRRAGETRPSAERRKAIARMIAWASGVEGVAIFIAAAVLANLGLSGFIVSAIAVIVGLHFLPLARGMGLVSYYIAGAVITLLGVAGVFIHDPHARVLVVSFGVAIALWATCVARLWFRKYAAAIAA